MINTQSADDLVKWTRSRAMSQPGKDLVPGAKAEAEAR